MSPNTFRVRWHPTNVLQAGFHKAVRVLGALATSCAGEKGWRKHTLPYIRQAVSAPSVFPNMNLPPGFRSLYTSFITVLWILYRAQDLDAQHGIQTPSVIPSRLRTSLSSDATYCKLIPVAQIILLHSCIQVAFKLCVRFDAVDVLDRRWCRNGGF